MRTMSNCPFCHAETKINDGSVRRYTCGTEIDKRAAASRYVRKCN